MGDSSTIEPALVPWTFRKLSQKFFLNILASLNSQLKLLVVEELCDNQKFRKTFTINIGSIYDYFSIN